MQKSLSRGALVTGAVGGFLFGLAYLVLVVLTTGRDASALEGFYLLYGPLAALGSILMSVGIFASARLFGGMQVASGIFAILAGLGALATLVLPMLMQFNSMSDMAIVLIAMPLGTTLLFGLFAGMANLKHAKDGRKTTTIAIAAHLYNIGAIGSGIALKFGLGEKRQTFVAIGAISALVFGAGVITHAIGLLQLRNEPVRAEAAAPLAA